MLSLQSASRRIAIRRPKLKLDSLLAFITLAETRDVGLAASELGLTPSAVRKQIETVERTLGIDLFEGKKSALALTEDGEIFVVDARVAVEHAILAEEKAVSRQELKRHRLRIGHSTYLPPKLIALIHRLHIEDRPLVRIKHVSGVQPTIVRQVLDGSLDMGISFLPIHERGLVIRPIYEEAIVACIPNGHALATKASIYPHDLDGEPMVSVSRELLPALHWEIEDHFAGFGIILRIVVRTLIHPWKQ